MVRSIVVLKQNESDPAVGSGDLLMQDGWSRHDSQLGADRWVLERIGGPRYYVDVGANHGVTISNTYLLDKLGWRGLCIEPVETAGYEERTCVIESQVVGDQEGQQVEFVVGKDSVLSGNSAFLGKHAENARRGRTKVRKTTTLQTLLDRHSFPGYIDFLSLDTEGSEYEILKATDLNKYIFGHIAVEHNLEEPKRTNIRDLLLANGYQLDKEVEFDDWYVRTGCFANVTDTD